jgi:hypothetical protein
LIEKYVGSDKGGSKSSSNGAIIGGAIGGGLGAAIIIGVLIFFFCRRRKRNQKVTEAETGANASTPMMKDGFQDNTNRLSTQYGQSRKSTSNSLYLFVIDVTQHHLRIRHQTPTSFKACHQPRATPTSHPNKCTDTKVLHPSRCQPNLHHLPTTGTPNSLHKHHRAGTLNYLPVLHTRQPNSNHHRPHRDPTKRNFRTTWQSTPTHRSERRGDNAVLTALLCVCLYFNTNLYIPIYFSLAHVLNLTSSVHMPKKNQNYQATTAQDAPFFKRLITKVQLPSSIHDPQNSCYPNDSATRAATRSHHTSPKPANAAD